MTCLEISRGTFLETDFSGSGSYAPVSRRYHVDTVGKVRDAMHGSINAYQYAFNNPLKYIDPLGLSAEDVQTILLYYNYLVSQMGAEGHRFPYRGILPAAYNNLTSGIYDLTGGRYGTDYDVCLGQSQRVKRSLLASQEFVPRMFDASWRFKTLKVPGMHHYVVGAVSSDLSDPIIFLDPLFGTAYLTDR